MENKICTIDGCNEELYSSDYCRKHFGYLKRNGDPEKYLIERHGMAGTPIYRSWQHMKERCYDLGSNRYYCYGARGITVCDRWRNSFIAFYKDMGPKPFPKAQIDREENDGNYEPDNCRWTTAAINSQNRHRTKANPIMVKEIRDKFKKGRSKISISKDYDISPGMVSRIVLRKTWKNIK